MDKPLINVVTITNRPVFREFLQYNFDIQDYPNKKFILIDGKGTIGAKYQAGLEQCAPGTLVTFFDDDDICSSKRLSWCYEQAKDKMLLVSGNLMWVNLKNYSTKISGVWIWSLGLYPVDKALEIGFDVDEHVGADGTFLLKMRGQEHTYCRDVPPILIPISHAINVYNFPEQTNNYYWRDKLVNPDLKWYSKEEWDRIESFLKEFKLKLYPDLP